MKYVAWGVLGMMTAFLAAVYIQDQLFYHPLTSSAVKDLFGQENAAVQLERKIDFVGIDIHGGRFDFHQFSLNPATVHQFISEGKCGQYPLFRDSLYQDKRRAGPLAMGRWKQTPLVAAEDAFYMQLIDYNLALVEHAASRRLVQARYLHNPGNYYAYFSTFPVGYYLYVLVPGTNTLYMVRKKG